MPPNECQAWRQASHVANFQPGVRCVTLHAIFFVIMMLDAADAAAMLMMLLFFRDMLFFITFIAYYAFHWLSSSFLRYFLSHSL